MRRQRLSGGLLLEVLVALGLVTMTLVVVAGVFPFSYTADRKAWNFTTAQRLVASELDSLRGEEFDNVVSRVNVVNVETTTYRIETTVNDYDTPPKNKRKLVTCRIVWQSKKGPETLVRDCVLARLNRITRTD